MTSREDLNGKKSILIIEDDDFLVTTYRIKFEKEGFNALIATNRKEIMSALEKEPPHVVLLDLMLPGISGFDILEIIKKNEKWKNIPVIILSNLGQAQDIERGKKLGVVDYFIKTNVKINDVVKVVKKYV